MIGRIKRAIYIWRRMGIRVLIIFTLSKLRSYTQKHNGIDNYEDLDVANSVRKLIAGRFPTIASLRTRSSERKGETTKINIITDSIASGSLFGGVGTSLIFAAILANKRGARLRIITRAEPPQPSNLDRILSLYGITLDKDVQFKFAPPWERRYEIDIADGDLFITTSWWTTAATLPSVPHNSIIYLLQEDERMFYAFDDERLRCENVLQRSDIRFLINTKLLFDHFVSDNFDNFRSQAVWFEPAFPKNVFYKRSIDGKAKCRFFFYARPKNPRNLFYLGLQVIDQSIVQGILDLDVWEVFLVGKDIPEVTFNGGYTPIKCENLSWSEYADFIGTVDLGLSLMYTPHPSYPPLDLAASGAVVVTNEYADKRDLSAYSRNIICSKLTADALVSAVADGVKLAANASQRDLNYRNSNMSVDWHEVFTPAVQRFAGEH